MNGIFFFCPSPQKWPHRGDPTSGVYEQPTNTHCFALGCVCGLLMMEENIRPTLPYLSTRYKGIMEKYPPFPRRGLIYRHLRLRLRHHHHHHFGKRVHVVSWFRGSLISKVCQVVFSLMSKMRRIHGYIVAFLLFLSERREREREIMMQIEMIQMNESWMIEPRDILTWQLQNVSWISLDTSGR